ncbi:MAG TPA: hypothetical protein VEA69_03950 [Tepidisphaeraceae bacterium]|nr:hypothetical protein [Tepidisphaeraceae bacterium]
MVRPTLDLSDDEAADVDALAKAAGYGSVDAYFRAMFATDDSGKDLGAPFSVCYEANEALEAMLVERLDSAQLSIEPTAQFWKNLTDEIVGPKRRM